MTGDKLASYRLALRGQQYLDHQILDQHAVQYVTFDLAERPWSRHTPLKTGEWQSVHAVALQHVRPSDVETVQRRFRRWGFEHQVHQPVGSLLYCCREPIAHSETPAHLPVLTADNVVVTGFTAAPDWPTLRHKAAGCHVLLGTLGFDRYTLPLARVAQKALGLHHAWCLADVESHRWEQKTPAGTFGLFTHPGGEWRQMCYVKEGTVYADCRVVADAGWVLVRIVSDKVQGPLPLSMQLRHPQFQDYLALHPSLAEDTQALTALVKLVSDGTIVETLRFVRKRNQDGEGQPTWPTVSNRCKHWDRIWTLKLAHRNDRDVVVLQPWGSLLLYMAKFSR